MQGAAHPCLDIGLASTRTMHLDELHAGHKCVLCLSCPSAQTCRGPPSFPHGILSLASSHHARNYSSASTSFHTPYPTRLRTRWSTASNISVGAPTLPGAVVTFPWEPRWPDLQVRSSSPRISPDYGVVVEVATEADVQATVAFANRYDIPFLAVSGTHGWPSSLEKLSDGIQINLRKLNATVLSQGGKTAHVGGGTLQYEITRSLFALGKYAGEMCPFSLNLHCADDGSQSPGFPNVSQLQVRCSEVAIVCCRANMATLLTTSFPRVS
jgi:hypothetical protein